MFKLCLNPDAVLENLLEAVKPPYPPNTDELHYLLRTPFRYLLLKWGSRFGKIDEPSIFYGGCSIDVTLTESAYYHFVFLHLMEDIPSQEVTRPSKPLHSGHTLFTVDYKTSHGCIYN